MTRNQTNHSNQYITHTPTIILITGHISNSAKFCENVKIPRQRANSAVWLETPRPVENCGPRHQSREWTILRYANCYIQGQVIGFQVLPDSLHPCSTRAFQWSMVRQNVNWMQQKTAQ